MEKENINSRSNVYLIWSFIFRGAFDNEAPATGAWEAGASSI